jgi:putative SOS response-associated peptidase YedK
MPVILKPEAFKEWMQPDTSPDNLKEIISTQIHTDFAFHPVSKAVNSVENNTEDLIEAA